jgi:ligand-binding SRPBCC domain-containing protein
MVEDKKMPLPSYTWTHKDAILTKEERTKLIDWANSVMGLLKTQYPIDSLVRRPSS